MDHTNQRGARRRWAYMKHVAMVVAKQRLNPIGQAAVLPQDTGQNPREPILSVDIVPDPHPCRVLRRERRAPRGEVLRPVAELHLRGFEGADVGARPAGAGKPPVEPVLEGMRMHNPVLRECSRRLREGPACPPQALYLPKSPARGTTATRVTNGGSSSSCSSSCSSSSSSSSSGAPQG